MKPIYCGITCATPLHIVWARINEQQHSKVVIYLKTKHSQNANMELLDV